MSDKIIERKYFMLRHPFTCIVSGPTGSGKTILVRRLLKNWKKTILLENDNNKSLDVFWVYGQFQELYKQRVENTNIVYSEFLPKLEELKNMNVKIIVIDDLMNEMGKNEKMSELFTRGSHHMNLSVIFIVQNLFHQSKQMRTISLNSQYIILLNNFRDQNQIEFLGKQLFKSKSRIFVKAFEDSVSRPYGYLLIDLKPDTPKQYRLKTRMTAEELPPSKRAKTSFSPIYYIIHD
jgi:uridine kinase